MASLSSPVPCCRVKCSLLAVDGSSHRERGVSLRGSLWQLGCGPSSELLRCSWNLSPRGTAVSKRLAVSCSATSTTGMCVCMYVGLYVCRCVSCLIWEWIDSWCGFFCWLGSMSGNVSEIWLGWCGRRGWSDNVVNLVVVGVVQVMERRNGCYGIVHWVSWEGMSRVGTE